LKQTFGYIKLIKADMIGNKTIIYKTGYMYVGRVLFEAIIVFFVVSVILGLTKVLKENSE
jgi:hypothetical protein